MKAPDAMQAVPHAVMRAPSTPDARRLARLPHHESLELDATNAAPGKARRWLARLLPEWSLAEFLDVCSLVASELVTNAVTATNQAGWPSGPPPVRLSLSADPFSITLLSWDATMTAPVPNVAGEADESGRGLAIIAGLSADCGYYFPDKSRGKITWAIIEDP